MKKMIFLAPLFFTIFSFAQQDDPTYWKDPGFSVTYDKCHCSLLPPSTVILSNSAGDRFSVFAEKKKGCNMDNCNDEITYSPVGMLALLNNIVAKKKNYDGVRAYLVEFPAAGHIDSGSQFVPPNDANKFGIIYVPTTYHVQHLSRIHRDDTANCLVILGDTVIRINSHIASLWIRKAEGHTLYEFEKEGQKPMKGVNKPYHETHSLWYSIHAIWHKPFYNGIIDILKCRICSNNITAVKAKFGAFSLRNIHANRRYQLTLIFAITNGSVNDFITMSEDDLLTDSKDGSDTGRPCPPPNPCNQTVGVLLPAK